MSLNTVLVLRADAQKLRTLFELPEGDGFLTAGSAPDLRVRLLEDGALVRTRHPFGTEPDTLLTALRAEMGRALALHDDPKGLFVAPSVASMESSQVDDVVGEVGEGGEWIPLTAKRKSPSVSELLGAGGGAPAAGMPDLSALLGGLGGAGSGLPDLGALAAQMGIALPEGAAEQVTAMLQGEGGAALLSAASEMAQNLSGDELSRLAAGDLGSIAGKAQALASNVGLPAAPDAAAVEPAAQPTDDDDDGER